MSNERFDDVIAFIAYHHQQQKQIINYFTEDLSRLFVQNKKQQTFLHHFAIRADRDILLPLLTIMIKDETLYAALKLAVRYTDDCGNTIMHCLSSLDRGAQRKHQALIELMRQHFPVLLTVKNKAGKLPSSSAASPIEQHLRDTTQIIQRGLYQKGNNRPVALKLIFPKAHQQRQKLQERFSSFAVPYAATIPSPAAAAFNSEEKAIVRKVDLPSKEKSLPADLTKADISLISLSQIPEKKLLERELLAKIRGIEKALAPQFQASLTLLEETSNLHARLFKAPITPPYCVKNEKDKKTVFEKKLIWRVCYFPYYPENEGSMPSAAAPSVEMASQRFEVSNFLKLVIGLRSELSFKRIIKLLRELYKHFTDFQKVNAQFILAHLIYYFADQELTENLGKVNELISTIDENRIQSQLFAITEQPTYDCLKTIFQLRKQQFQSSSLYARLAQLRKEFYQAELPASKHASSFAKKLQQALDKGPADWSKDVEDIAYALRTMSIALYQQLMLAEFDHGAWTNKKNASKTSPTLSQAAAYAGALVTIFKYLLSLLKSEEYLYNGVYLLLDVAGQLANLKSDSILDLNSVQLIAAILSTHYINRVIDKEKFPEKYLKLKENFDDMTSVEGNFGQLIALHKAFPALQFFGKPQSEVDKALVLENSEQRLISLGASFAGVIRTRQYSFMQATICEELKYMQSAQKFPVDEATVETLLAKLSYSIKPRCIFLRGTIGEFSSKTKEIETCLKNGTPFMIKYKGEMHRSPEQIKEVLGDWSKLITEPGSMTDIIQQQELSEKLAMVIKTYIKSLSSSKERIRANSCPEASSSSKLFNSDSAKKDAQPARLVSTKTKSPRFQT